MLNRRLPWWSCGRELFVLPCERTDEAIAMRGTALSRVGLKPTTPGHFAVTFQKTL